MHLMTLIIQIHAYSVFCIEKVRQWLPGGRVFNVSNSHAKCPKIGSPLVSERVQPVRFRSSDGE